VRVRRAEGGPFAGRDLPPARASLTVVGAFGVGVLVAMVAFGIGVVAVDGSRTIELFTLLTVLVMGALAMRLAHAVGSARVALDAVRSRERRLTTITETLNDVVFISDADGEMVFVSESIQRVLGLSIEEFLTRSVRDRMHPDDREQYLRDGAYLRSTPGASIRAEMRIEVADGDWRWLDARAVNLLDHPDVRGLITSVQDITERKAVLDQLRGSEERFRTLADSAPLGVFRIRADGSFDYLNRSALDILEIPPEWLLGLGRDGILAGDWAPEAPQVRDRLIELYGSILDGVERISDVRYQPVSGGERWLDFRMRPLTGSEGTSDGVIGTIEDVTEARMASARLVYQATHDPLTGLPNRRLLLETLGTAMDRADEEARLLAVLFCDLDLFKVVNDSLGHDVGDQLLPAVAGRFSAMLSDHQTLARFGGDEFVVICDGLTTADDAELLAHRLVEALREPIAVGEHRIKVATSIGVALRRLDHDRPDALIRDADLAMYRAKETGRNRVAVFDDSLRAKALRRMSLEQSLRQALERDELTLAYQPIVSLAEGRFHGAEALLRWDSPVHGVVSPAEFILIAEEIGLVIDLDEWVLDRACHQLAAWRSQHPHHPFTLSVNLSGRHLVRHDLVSRVRQALAVTQVDPATLTLEITETAVMADAETSIGVLDDLKRLGVRLAIDDFGTGYSSLSYLRRFPVDVLKIDRTFVDGLGQEIGDTEIVRLVVTLARTLGLATVAEGVETTTQLDELRALGCDLAQGFLLSRPITAEAMGAILARPEDAWPLSSFDRRTDARRPDGPVG